MKETHGSGTRGHRLDPPDPLRKLSPALFAAVVSVFFLPFVTCYGTTVSGVQAATGITPPGSDPAAARFANATSVPNPFALVAFLCAGAGIALMARRGRAAGPFASALAGIVGALSLGGFVINAIAEAHGRIAIEFGLPLAFLGFFGTVALNDLLLVRIPLLEAGDDAALARRSATARRWITGLGTGLAALLFIGAAVNLGAEG